MTNVHRYRKTFTRLPFAAFVLLAGALLSQTSAAQERWFQIELLAFSRQVPSQEEQWPTNIRLGYPHNIVELKDPDQPPASVITSHAGGDEPVNAADISADRETPAKPDIEREPFYVLPASERNLSRQATALQRNGGYQVLFHQSWRQPINNSKNSPAIIIQGGSNYGQHTELEGSITFSLPQLLQINTRLWLTRFEPNYGQEPGEWPALPKTPAQLRAELQAESALSASLFNEQNDWLSMNTTTAPVEVVEPYLPQRVILLQEERRLRQGELHYIDHPLLGIIVQITPYAPEP